ncbi:MAG: DNA gyrase inhibitor YacG [Nitrospirae bacterium CG_4_9_14_3_um_filter_53_35]|nr:MAG: DNA gyrase inhibitor YacG [Nitrospirae bacterium CG08_land_8_20_14_0_20_52_24]PIV83305.1 MAG: DNA gyrase inhibitor YacG [Nitrospirae bacterium CG17_big_fil_post_rev_8_21_14_2_50_50_9]PIW85447.1 MAG: DNA gyrase inhibitor YacG [Nitrospirae bacterium CG_4_8_14_3_um_filter_50_41]PIX84653.1 MAG: DNA gyrase inhibitor YacG [Nitrospirae bacterium CG_4_10_14_3_um_filter_53_41]PJA76747.1 MAG: DNA gyrase inhibitor YacG [Nitrospirae bacterium CG_4_9_14_3_um_filter_53_35]
MPQVPCPICRKMTDWYDNPYRPFCSERCKLLDLGAWASEGYRVPGEPVSYEPSGGKDEEEKPGPEEGEDDEGASL